MNEPTVQSINRRVLEHDAILGKVEAEFDECTGDAGCGCAYPDAVDADAAGQDWVVK